MVLSETFGDSDMNMGIVLALLNELQVLDICFILLFNHNAMLVAVTVILHLSSSHSNQIGGDI